jgi:ABC-type sugar transport system ATPase subunit
MADRIAVLNEGVILQIGSPHDIYDHPATTFVATLVGTPRINLLSAGRENGKVFVKDSELHIPTASDTLPQNFLLGIRPEDIQPADGGQFSGRVVLTEPLGVETIVHIQSGQQTLLSIVPGTADFNIDDNIQFNIVHERLHYFDLEGQRI